MDEKTVEVEAVEPLTKNGKTTPPGGIVSVSANDAKTLIAKQKAKPVKKEK